ncbi:MAG: hypothetical protein KDD51_02010 [Bdellovibrionales bacterium]|nr:hypothetical protein [Bdellovibrionales bacterium]
MSVLLTLFGAVVGTATVLFGFYALVLGVLSVRARAARPKFGIAATGDKGQFAFWFSWDPAVYAIEAYRMTVNVLSPSAVQKEMRFTVTMDPPAKAPFWQPVILPQGFREMLADDSIKSREALITVSLRTTDELCLHKTFYVGSFRKLLASKPGKAAGLSKLEPAEQDAPSVSSLDYSELVVRKDKLKNLIAQAKAKAAAKKPAEPKKEAPKPAPAAEDKPGVAEGKV